MLKKILGFPGRVLGFLFGRLTWTPPLWLSSIIQVSKKSPKASWASVTMLVAFFIGYQYYLSLPKPILIDASIAPPGLTPNVENPVPDNLSIVFNYDYRSLKPGRRRPEGPPSVARIDLIDKPVNQGIKMSPAIPGEWKWQGDRRLVFKPQRDWPAGVAYKIDLEKSIFTEETRLKTGSCSFTTQPFKVAISELQFYQEPQTPSVRKIVTTLSFTHPVDKESLLGKLSLTMRPSGSTMNVMARKYDYTVDFDKNQREAYVHSVPVQLPREANYMRLEIDDGVKPAIGGNGSEEKLGKEVLIPSIFSFLKITDTSTRIVPNEKQEPEQLLLLGFTDFIAEEELLSKLSVYLLPERNPGRNSKSWSSPREVTPAVLADSEKVAVTLIPNEQDSAREYSFRYDAPEGRSLYVRIDEGLRSVNNFIQESFYDNVLAIPRYPKEVRIVGEGSILTNSGDHKLSLLARGHKHLKISIGRVLPGQIAHLVSQTSGDINDPYFRNYAFDKENLAEFHEEILALKPAHPKEANYSAVDLSRYLTNGSGAFGLFFMEIKGWDKKTDREVHGRTDKRLILITDLGLLIKNNSDTSHDVFVQSMKTGKPVNNAIVELLGLNGLPLYTAVTGNDGHVRFAGTRDFHREKEPSVYVVKTGNDISFIPFNRSSRQINYSGFDVGGNNPDGISANRLSAYAFTDRGIYRPGEEIKAGVIVKREDLANIDTIPLELVVTNPRNNDAKVEKIQLPEKGFIDFSYATDPTTETGAYRLAVYLVRDNGYRGEMIGSAGFRVEEFQPDTLKMESRLIGAEQKGWFTGEMIQARIKLANLFGTPAQDRKISGQISVAPTGFRFKEYKDYTFHDPFSDRKDKPLTITETLEDTRTDAEGRASFEIPLDRFDKGTYVLNFSVEGFEPDGGRSVSARNSAMLSPLPYLVGYKSDGTLDYINKGTDRTIELIAVDPRLERLDKEGLATRLVEIQHVSTLVKQKNGTYQYQTVTREKEIITGAIDITREGTTKYLVPTAVPGDFALEIYGESGLRLSRIKFTIVGHANLTGNLEKNAELQLKLNKADYRPGEIIELNITAPYTGSGLITIESDRVHAHKWFSTDTASSMQTIQVPADLEGNAYLNVAFIRSPDSREIFMSPLSYAVAPFTIDRSKRQVAVDLKVPDQVEPGRKMEISYQTSRPSRIVVFAVDEGILQVAHYKTPAPLDHFLRKRALGVTTLQILDLILPDFNLVQAVSASGGGERAKMALAKNLNPFARMVDTPAVFWSGILDADASERVVSFTVPDSFAGTLRVMAVAVSEDAMGVNESATLVRGPFVISPNVLTQAAPGDIFETTVGIANLVENSGPTARVDIEIIPSEHLEIVGESRTSLVIGEGDEGKTTFKVRVREKLGAASLAFVAELGDRVGRRTSGLSVRPAMPYDTSFSSGFTDSGKVKVEIPRQIFPELAEQRVAASASPLVLVDGLSSYLKNFPHGCTEQVVSQVFPLVGLMTHPGFEPQSKAVRDSFTVLIGKLRQRQLADGGFSFWPGGRNTAAYPSIYVMHFLLEAQDLGYPVPSDMMQRGKDFLNAYAGRDCNSLAEARVRANAIYLLTRLGTVSTNYLVHLQTYLERAHNKYWKEDLTAVYMAATYQLLQKREAAEELISHYRMGSKTDLQNGDFHSILTRDAQYVYLLANHFESLTSKLAGEDLLRFVEPVFHGEYNTIAAAYSILALGAYSKRLGMDFTELIDFTAVAGTDGSVSQLPSDPSPFPNSRFATDVSRIEITSPEAVYYIVSQAGFDRRFPEKEVREGLEIMREYLNDGGEEITSFEQGKEITVRLRIRALDGKSVSNVAVIDLLPGGFEVLRDSVPRTAYNWLADYVDVREDRVVYYGSFDTSVKELNYRVKLTSAGEFAIPPAFAGSMYDRGVRAVSRAGEFTVTSSK
ncbi:MAG: alpha-2-macroglobulin family protein [Proteobacteria bacterium]|nr:alpha-2-macroglobulin family protein [Pseudomonadota bacterium]MBU1737922.1 alpha-2-macroglobulin family protein [Pseudomonadota bacterium]